MLAGVDRVFAAQKRIGRAGLHLDKDDLSPVAGDDIDLSELVFIILFQNFTAVLFQMFRGELLAQCAEFGIGEVFVHRQNRYAWSS